MISEMERAMNVYTVEVNGRAVVAFNADDDVEAEAFVAIDDAFRNDLRVLENDGTALWNGTDPLSFRKALESEAQAFAHSYERAIGGGEADEGNEWVCFLVPVKDPTDEFQFPGGKT